MWKRASKFVLAGCVALFVAAGALLWTSPTSYKVDFDAVLDIWGDVARDVDSFTKTATRVSVRKEIEVGDAIAKRLWVKERTGRDQAYVEGVGQRIAAHARRQDIPFRFHVVESRDPNAWAVAGGHIYITTSLLDLLQTEAELAAVLGHEIAHVDLRHCIELLQYELLLRRAGFGDMAILVSIAEQLVRFGYSEVQEREADRLGLLLAAEAGYAPLGALDAFKRMYVEFGPEEADSAQTKGPEGEITRALSEALEAYFATHPPFLDRLDELRSLLDWNMSAWEGRDFYLGASNHRDRLSRRQAERAEEFVTYSASSPAYLLARAEIAGLVGRTNEALAHYADVLEKDPQSRAAREGLVALYLRIGQPDEALDQLGQIITALQVEVSALESELSALPPEETSAAADLRDRIIARLIEIRKLRLSRIDIMEKAQSPGLEAERQLLEDLDAALFDAHMRRAEEHMAAGRFDDARADFRASKSLQPDSLEAIKGEIGALKGMRYYFAALRETTRAVARFPEIADFLRIRAEIYRLLGREEDAEREMERYRRFEEAGVPPLTDAAWADFVKMLEHPSGAKAMAMWENGRYRALSTGKFLMRSAAAAALKDCARDAGRDCALYALGDSVVWGLSEAELDRLIRAYDDRQSSISASELSREDFTSSRELSAMAYELTEAILAGDESLRLARANLYRRLGILHAALHDAKVHLAAFPQSLDGRLLRGLILLDAREYERAFEDFRDVTARAPGSEQAALSHAAIAEIHLQNDDFDAAVREFRSARLPADLQPLLDHGMCLALARRALPAAALPHCEAALRAPGGGGNAQFHDTRAFVLWQLRRTNEARAELSRARQLDPRRPFPDARIPQFRVLIVEIFLQREGVTPGRVDGVYDTSTASAVEAYRTREDLPVSVSVGDDLVGHITPLGFGRYRIEGIRGQLAPGFIRMACVPATRGTYKTVRAANGRLYLCNSDGVSVRALGLPRRLDYESRARGEWLRCYDPDRDIVFSLDPGGPPGSLRSCGGNSYRISEEDYRKIQNR